MSLKNRMESFGNSPSVSHAAFRSAESDALALEIMQHQQEDKNRSYLSKFVVGLSECIHGNDKSLEHLDSLRQSAMLANMAGDSKGAEETRKQMSGAVSTDKDARLSADSWSSHAGNFVKSVGLFFPGKAGFAIAALSNAADSAHPADSVLRQSADGILGAGKGAAMKFAFDKVGQSEMNMALKAGTLSMANRFSEIGLNSHTYFDQKTGDFDFSGGLLRTGKALANPRQLGMDLVTFGGGYLLLNKLGLTPEFAKANPMLAQTMTGAGFGFSSGFFANLQMQQELGDGFQLSSALKSGLLQMSLDGAAAAVGGYRMQQIHGGAAESSDTNKIVAPSDTSRNKSQLDMSQIQGIYGLDPRPVATHHAPADGGASRENLTTPAQENLAASAQRAPARENLTATRESFTVPSQEIPTVSEKANSATKDLAAPISNKDAAVSTEGKIGIRRSLTADPSPGIREFVTRENVSNLLETMRAQGLNAKAFLQVQEILPGSASESSAGQTVSAEKSLLISHVEPGMKTGAEKFAGADLLATCDPKLLEALGVKDLWTRHLFPDAGSAQVTLQVPGSNRLRFSLTEPLKNSPFANEPGIVLGQEKANTSLYKVENPRDPIYEQGPFTVSSLLRGLDINDNISNVHSIDGRLGIDEMAQALHTLKAPAERIIGGGGDSIAFELTDGKILKITDRPWDSTWGNRTIDWKGQQVRMDANMLGSPRQIHVGDHTITYYVQQDGITPVAKADARLFDSLVQQDGKFEFWDLDRSDLAHGPDQLAYVPLQRFKSGLLTAIPIADPVTGKFTRGLALIDYDAVRTPDKVPQGYSGSSDGGVWRYGRYLSRD